MLRDMAGTETDRVAKARRADAATACVLVLDSIRTRRGEVALWFRKAGCLVVETSRQGDVARTLAANQRSWVLVVVDAAASQTFCDGYPDTPIVHIGGSHKNRISGRISLNDVTQPSADVHGLVMTRGMN